MELRKGSVSDLFWEFGYAESQNDERHDRCYSQGLGPGLFERVRAGERGTLTPQDWERLRATVVGTRPEYLRPLETLELEWLQGWVRPGELPELKVPRLNIFLPSAPSRRLAEFVETLEEGGQPGNGFASHYERLKGSFDPQKVRGAPVLLCESDQGPFTIVEGMTRLSVLCCRSSLGRPVPPRVQVLVGRGPRVVEWPFY